jgi:hypothetical protein
MCNYTDRDSWEFRLKKEKRDDIIFTLGLVIAILAIVVGLLFAIIPNTIREKAYYVADFECGERGYQSSAVYNDVCFCVTYGEEPSLVRLGTVYELAPRYEK